MSVPLHSKVPHAMPHWNLSLVTAFCIFIPLFSDLADAQNSKTTPKPSITLAEALDQGDFVLYNKVLHELIASRERGGKIDADDSIGIHALAVAELIRTTGVEGMNTVAATLEGRVFLKKFLADRTWVAMYLSSGPVPSGTPDGLLTLMAIVTADREAQSDRYRPLATAVALTFHSGEPQHRLIGVGDSGCPPLTPLTRYFFYKESHQAGKLHPMFETLDAWALRWVVIAPVGNESLAWLQERIDVPLSQIDGICWVPRYRGVNDFGNTIQGPLFYAPSRSQMTWAEDIATNGGVCGSLSTFGATYAQARGIPATPKGQPGHCAYAYRAAPGEWIPGFGGPDGGSAYDFWRDSFAYTWMADDLFSDVENTRAAYRLYWHARYRLETQGLRQAMPLYMQAIRTQPLHYEMRCDLLDACLADKSGFLTAKDWQLLAEELLVGMQKHPLPMCDLLAKFEEEHLWRSLTPEKRTRFFIDVHQAIAANLRPGWTPWNLPQNVVGRQMKGLEGSEVTFFRDVLACYVRSGHNYMVGELMGWGSERFAKTPELEEQFIGAVIQAFARGGKVDETLRRRVFEQAIKAAESSRNIAGFQKLSKAAADIAGSPSNYDYKKPISGRLVSDEGLLYIGATDGYDPPLQHRAVLTEQGGMFHGPGKIGNAFNSAVVVLPKSCRLGEIVLVNRPGHEARCRSLTVSVSSDEQNWTIIGTTDTMEKEFRLDLRGKNIGGRWIKVEKTAPESEPFHLRNICIYAE